MRLRVCGCHGGESRQTELSSFLIDESLALDAGSLTRALTLEEQARIRHVLVTHAHLDHVRDLAFLADNLCSVVPEPVTVWSLPESIAVIRNDLMLLFAAKSSDELGTRSGKEALQTETLASIQKVLEREAGAPGVEAVYFTSFVMQ